MYALKCCLKCAFACCASVCVQVCVSMFGLSIFRGLSSIYCCCCLSCLAYVCVCTHMSLPVCVCWCWCVCPFASAHMPAVCKDKQDDVCAGTQNSTQHAKQSQGRAKQRLAAEALERGTHRSRHTYVRTQTGTHRGRTHTTQFNLTQLEK